MVFCHPPKMKEFIDEIIELDVKLAFPLVKATNQLCLTFSSISSRLEFRLILINIHDRETKPHTLTSDA